MINHEKFKQPSENHENLRAAENQDFVHSADKKNERKNSEKMKKKVQKFLDAHEKALIGGFGRNGWTKKALAPLKQFIKPFKENSDLVGEYLRDPLVSPLMIEALRQAYVFELDGKEAREENKWSFGLILEDVRFSLGELEKQLHHNDPGEVKRVDTDNKELIDKLRFRSNVMYVVSESLDHVEDSDRLAVNAWFKQNFEIFKKAMRVYKTGKDSTDCIAEHALINIISRSNDKDLVESCLELANDKDRGLFEGQNDLKSILDESQHQIYAENRKQLALFLAKKSGLDSQLAQQLVVKWQKSKESLGKDKDGLSKIRESYSANLDTLKDLEEARPGAAKELFEKFGIANFDRYPIKGLLDQLDKADQDLPYGVVAFPEADYNGAFMQKRWTLQKLRSDLLAGGQETRFIEVGSQYELARRLARMHQKYSGAGNKMDFLVIGGHGQPDSIQLGKKDVEAPPIRTPELTTDEYQKLLETWRERQDDDERIRMNLKMTDLHDGGAQGVRRAAEKWFDEETQIVFVSCSTGAEGGFAQKVTDELGFTTIAPNIPAYVKNIKVSFNERGKPVFDVDYGGVSEEKAEAMRYEPNSNFL